MASIGNDRSGRENFFVRTKRRIVAYVKEHKWKFIIISALAFLVLCWFVGFSKSAFSVFTGKELKYPKILYGLVSPVPYLVMLFGWIIFFYVRLNLRETLHDTEGNFNYTGEGSQGSARFMTEDEKFAAFYVDVPEKLDGLILGWNLDKYNEVTSVALSPKESNYLNGHTMIMGGSGMRKTSTILLPMLLSYIRNGESMICSDPKGELVAYLKTLLIDRGYTVRILNLKKPQCSDGIDFLAQLRSTAEDYDTWMTETISNATIFATTVMLNTSGDGGKTGRGDYWYDNAEAILKAAVLYELTRDDIVSTWRNVYDDICMTAAEFDEMIQRRPDNDPAKLAAGAFHENMIGDKQDVAASILSGLKSRLMIFINTSILRICSTDEIDLSLPGQKKCAYFFLSPDQESTMDFVKSMFFSTAFVKLVHYADDTYERKCKVRVNIVLEEAFSVGRIPDIDKKLSNIRSRGVGITMVFQNIVQLKTLYGDDAWKDIISECDTNIYLGGNESTDTADYYVNRLGTTTVENESIRRGRALNNPLTKVFNPYYMENIGATQRNLVTVDELMTLNLDHEIIFLKHKHPVRVGKFHYENHPLSREITETESGDHIPKWKRKDWGLPEDIQDEDIIDDFRDMQSYAARGYTYTYTEYMTKKADGSLPDISGTDGSSIQMAKYAQQRLREEEALKKKVEEERRAGANPNRGNITKWGDPAPDAAGANTQAPAATEPKPEPSPQQVAAATPVTEPAQAKEPAQTKSPVTLPNVGGRRRSLFGREHTKDDAKQTVAAAAAEPEVKPAEKPKFVSRSGEGTTSRSVADQLRGKSDVLKNRGRVTFQQDAQPMPSAIADKSTRQRDIQMVGDDE